MDRALQRIGARGGVGGHDPDLLVAPELQPSEPAALAALLARAVARLGLAVDRPEQVSGATAALRLASSALDSAAQLAGIEPCPGAPTRLLGELQSAVELHPGGAGVALANALRALVGPAAVVVDAFEHEDAVGPDPSRARG